MMKIFTQNFFPGTTLYGKNNMGTLNEINANYGMSPVSKFKLISRITTHTYIDITTTAEYKMRWTCK